MCEFLKIDWGNTRRQCRAAKVQVNQGRCLLYKAKNNEGSQELPKQHWFKGWLFTTKENVFQASPDKSDQFPANKTHQSETGTEALTNSGIKSES
jgi:hypothetical protein